MRLGILARADHTGLGYQTRAYYKHLNPAKTMLIDISALNGNEQHYEWYPDAMIVRGFPRPMHLEQFLTGLDVVLTAESPYNYELYAMARQMGVKTAVVYNYEFFDWFKYPEYPVPDLLISPSMWNFGEVNAWVNHRNLHSDVKISHVYLHHPVDREDFPFRLRQTKKFIHIAGKPAAQDRNGTWDYLAADPTGTVITQSDSLAFHIRRRYRQSRVLTNIQEPHHMYQMGDILVFPRRYGGNCLPLNEALSSGMPVIMPDISPNNYLLPKEWLVPASVTEYFEPRTRIPIYSVDHEALVEKLKSLQYCNIRDESYKANAIADSISWTTMKPKYLEALEGLCHESSLSAKLKTAAI